MSQDERQIKLYIYGRCLEVPRLKRGFIFLYLPLMQQFGKEY